MLTRLSRSLCLSSLTLVMAACASTHFYPHEARENEYLGKGGSRFTVEGIDVWFNGEPPRKYAIIGYIEDPHGLYSDEYRKSVEPSVLKKAHEIQADALIEIVLPSRNQAAGSMSIGTGFGRHGFGMDYGFILSGQERTNVKYTAIRYLDTN